MTFEDVPILNTEDNHEYDYDMDRVTNIHGMTKAEIIYDISKAYIMGNHQYQCGVLSSASFVFNDMLKNGIIKFKN